LTTVKYNKLFRYVPVAYTTIASLTVVVSKVS